MNNLTNIILLKAIEIDLDKSDSIRVKEIQALKNFHDSLIDYSIPIISV